MRSHIRSKTLNTCRIRNNSEQAYTKYCQYGVDWERERSAVFMETFKKSNIIKVWIYLGNESRKVGTSVKSLALSCKGHR